MSKKQVTRSGNDAELLAVISPRLDEAGNSVRAQKAIADTSMALGGNPLAVKAR